MTICSFDITLLKTNKKRNIIKIVNVKRICIMKNILKEFALAIVAGIAIAIGGVVFLSLCEQGIIAKIIGALMFTVGLYTIVLNGLFLYTGKVGYLVNEKPKYLVTLLTTWLGNFAGAFVTARLMLLTKYGSSLKETAYSLCQAKVSQTVISAFILSIFCGMLMFIAVDGYKQSKNPLILLLCVSVFILCGFEHCVANMFYFSVGEALSAKALGYLIIMTAGNSLGGILIPLVKKIK